LEQAALGEQSKKNTKSEWVSKNVAAKKPVCMEEHRKDRSRAQAVARADKKKQERLQRKRAEMQKEQEKEQPEAPAAAATTDTVRKTQVWLLEFEIARVRTYTEACVMDVATAVNGMTAVTNFQYGMKERGEVAVVKLHAKMCQGLKGIEALTAGAQVLTCVGETEDGGGEELHEWRELLQNNNEHRQELHEEVGIQRRKDLNEAAGQGMVYAVGISAAYTTSKAAMHVALQIVRWRATTLESTDTDIIPDSVGYVTAEGVLDPQNNSYPIYPPRTTN
jgi:hypothetical protein